jgi:RNase P subunit RPR2
MSLGRSSSMARGFVRVDREIELREENARLREALESISKNSCCDQCQQAKFVALQALARDEANQMQTQCWICPKCHDDHKFGGPCTPDEAKQGDE